MQNGSVEIDIKNKIATITFYHPQSNSLPRELLGKLATAITEVGDNNAVAVIVLKSQGNRVFCAGASFDELLAIDSIAAGKVFFSGFADVINAARKCPQLIIGRVQGKAVGGGVGVASAVDYCFATEQAAIKLSELAVGIGPFVVGPAVERKIGVSAMSQLAVDATQWQSATWAQQQGLYAAVFATIEELDQAVANLATQLAASHPAAMRLLKQTFWEGTAHWDELLAERASISGKLVLSDFTRNAITKFRNK